MIGLFVGRGRQGNVYLSCALLPRTWNNLDLIMATRCPTFAASIYILFVATGQRYRKDSWNCQIYYNLSKIVQYSVDHSQRTEIERTSTYKPKQLDATLLYYHVLGSHFS
jgi:hypothetical protein